MDTGHVKQHAILCPYCILSVSKSLWTCEATCYTLSLLYPQCFLLTTVSDVRTNIISNILLQCVLIMFYSNNEVIKEIKSRLVYFCVWCKVGTCKFNLVTKLWVCIQAESHRRDSITIIQYNRLPVITARLIFNCPEKLNSFLPEVNTNFYLL